MKQLAGMSLLYAIPGWIGLVLITLVCVVVACGGHLWVHRSFAKINFIEHNEVAGFILAVVGVLYAVLLGFITVVVWEHFSQADERAQSEVDAATDVWRYSELLPPQEATAIRHDVERYAVAVTTDEWPKMQRGSSSAAAQSFVLALFRDVAELPIRDVSHSNLQNRLFERVQLLADLRRDRINDVGTTVSPTIKLGLILGAVVVVGFLYLFGMKNFRVQLMMTGAMAAMIGILFAFILLLDYPFRGDVSISSDRWIVLNQDMVDERR